MTFLLKNSANNLIFASIFDSILDSRSSNSTAIFQFCDLASTLLRLQSFAIRLDDELRVGTPLRRYLTHGRPQEGKRGCLPPGFQKSFWASYHERPQGLGGGRGSTGGGTRVRNVINCAPCRGVSLYNLKLKKVKRLACIDGSRAVVV